MKVSSAGLRLLSLSHDPFCVLASSCFCIPFPMPGKGLLAQVRMAGATSYRHLEARSTSGCTLRDGTWGSTAVGISTRNPCCEQVSFALALLSIPIHRLEPSRPSNENLLLLLIWCVLFG